MPPNVARAAERGSRSQIQTTSVLTGIELTSAAGSTVTGAGRSKRKGLGEEAAAAGAAGDGPGPVGGVDFNAGAVAAGGIGAAGGPAEANCECLVMCGGPVGDHVGDQPAVVSCGEDGLAAGGTAVRNMSTAVSTRRTQWSPPGSLATCCPASPPISEVNRSSPPGAPKPLRSNHVRTASFARLPERHPGRRAPRCCHPARAPRP
jgi:hypothetical protein